MKNFLTKLFNQKPRSSATDETISTKNYLQEKNVKEIIYATSVFSDMDFSEMTGRVSQIIGVVDANEEGEQVKHALQHQYYKFLFHHFQLNRTLAKQAAEILGIDAQGPNDLRMKWPSMLSFEKYLELYQALKLDLVTRVNVNGEMAGKFIVVLNPTFWDYQYRDSYNLLIDITSTYERDFDKSDWIFDNEEDALNFGIFTFEKLCNDRNPDNSYYYNEQVIKQIGISKDREELQVLGLTPRKGIPWFTRENPADLPWSKADIHEVVKTRSTDLDLVKNIFAKIPNAPFYIVKSV